MIEEKKKFIFPQKPQKAKKRFSVLTLYLGDSIDLKKIKETFREYPIITREHPIILKIDKGQYAVLTKFGTVTFWNVPKRFREKFIDAISPFVENFDKASPYYDSLKVFIREGPEEVRFEKVFLSKIDKEKVQIISFALSQSVALEKYEKEVEQKIVEAEEIINTLKTGGLRWQREGKLISQIGEILAVKQKAISHLSLFDKPETTWERIEIERLYNKLYFELELGDRFDILNEKIKFLSDHHKLLLDFISAQKSSLLELIIVILIIVELFIFVLETFVFKK